jgi:predicted membrane protein
MRRSYYREDYRKFRHHRHNPKDRMFFGLIVVIIGILLLLRAMHLLFFSLAFSWPVLLIVIGILIGIKSVFRNPASWILILIGAANLTPQFYIMGQPSSVFAWPAVMILIGLSIVFRSASRRKVYTADMFEKKFPGSVDAVTSDSSMLNVDVTFGGRKEFVTSKDFKGGDVSVTFAGCEINLMQADSTESTMILDVKVSFGGLELIVPSHWDVQNEISPAFGSVEDQRMVQTAAAAEHKKTLILKGSCSFGSIEIKSY